APRHTMPLEIIDDEVEWAQRLRIRGGALDGALVELEVDVDLTEVMARDPGGREIGKLRFRLIEGDHDAQYYKLVWAFLDQLGPQSKYQGLGRAALQCWRRRSGEAAAVERHTGIPTTKAATLPVTRLVS